MKALLSSCAALLMVLIGVPGYAAEPLVPYDDFDATLLDPDKWFGGSGAVEFPSANTEAIRRIQDKRLHLVYRSYGQPDSNRGRPRNGFSLIFRDSSAVTAIQATVEVSDMIATGCPDNPEPTVASAMLGGFFFGSAGSSPGDEVRDMVAFIGVVRDSHSTAPADAFHVGSTVFFCANQRCTYGTELHGQDLGPVKRGAAVTLRVAWDQDNHRFIFQRDDAPEVLAPYAVSDNAPPSIPVKLLNAMHLIPNCTATPRPMAFTEAQYDDVLVNESAAPSSGK